MEKNGKNPRGGEHVPVLLHETLQLLAPKAGQTIVDATIGLGGHSSAILEKISPGGLLIGLDRDATAIQKAMEILAGVTPVSAEYRLFHAHFSSIKEVLQECGVECVDGVLLDIGVSSMQIDNPERGFSFMAEGPLDMRMSPENGSLSAAQIVANLSEKDLADLIYKYGEERFSRRIAKSLVEARREKTIRTTTELAEIVRRSVRGSSPIDKATRTFQALRIAVNDELGELEQALGIIPGLLAPGGRLAVITFHSLEDRLVKKSFREWNHPGEYKILVKKPVTASAEEKRVNPRSRSAKLRVLERCQA
ncbi:MAG: 16S rRNA (cytosine(1402)-N(4))-methyltransferase RsmH [Planctomycetes bacterium]|nr:16S rRNA (cytosine(1402)-N(4))-methyltransferase RsmH [Planctomycetota bacterium]